MAKKVFIVDDDHDMVDSLTMVLEGNGFEVAATYKSTDALERIREIKPDLIILDVMFPENPSEGFDIARRLHNDETVGKIPIIMLSAVNAKFKLGFSDKDRDDDWLPVKHFIEKPIIPEKLISMVNEVLA